jgi:cullin 1
VLIDSGRKLQWLWHMQRCEFKTNYLSQKLIFTTNAFQMAILLQFNESDSITLEDLHTATSIPEQTLKNHLIPMVKMKVLIQDGDTYDLNLSTSFGNDIAFSTVQLTIRFQVEKDQNQSQYARSS